MKLFVLTAIFIGCTVLSAEKKENKLPDDVLKVLESAEKLTVFSVDPHGSEDKTKDLFHGYEIKGKTDIAPETDRKELLAALRKGIAENHGEAAMCFEPRHGLQATHDGKTFDLLICFTCLQIYIYETAAQSETAKRRIVLVSESPRATFNKFLKAANVPLAPEHDEAKK